MIGLLALLAAAEAVSSPPPGAAVAAAPVPASVASAAGVEIVIAAPTPASSLTVRQDLEELLARHGVAARYRETVSVDRDEVRRPAALAPCALACIWVDLGVAAPGRAFVYISATASEQVVVRTLTLPAGVDEVAREEVAQIVASSVEALQAGRPLPPAAEKLTKATETVTKVEPAPPPAPAPRALWLAVGVGAGAAREAAGTFAAPTVAISLLAGRQGQDAGRLAPALWIQAAGFSTDPGGDPVALRFRGGELAALATIGTSGTSARTRAVARLGLGPGVELRAASASVAGGAAPDGIALDATPLEPSLFVRAAARLEVRLAPRVGLFAAAACDARVVSHRYTVTRDDGTIAAGYEPDRVRPSILVGVDAWLAGEAAR